MKKSIKDFAQSTGNMLKSFAQSTQRTLSKIFAFFAYVARQISAFFAYFARTPWKFVLKYNEWFFSFPIGFLIFWYGTKRMFMSGLNVYDHGISQKLLIGTAFFFFILGMARIIQKLQWPHMSKKIDEDTNGKWKEISSEKQHLYSIVTWSVIVLSLSILIASI